MPHETVTVGGVVITPLCDHEGRFPRPLATAFPDVAAPAWARFRPRYPEAFDDDDGWRFHVRCYLLRTDDAVILFDTGIGPSSTVGASWAGGAGPQDDISLVAFEIRRCSAANATT